MRKMRSYSAFVQFFCFTARWDCAFWSSVAQHGVISCATPLTTSCARRPWWKGWESLIMAAMMGLPALCSAIGGLRIELKSIHFPLNHVSLVIYVCACVWVCVCSCWTRILEEKKGLEAKSPPCLRFTAERRDAFRLSFQNVYLQ